MHGTAGYTQDSLSRFQGEAQGKETRVPHLWLPIPTSAGAQDDMRAPPNCYSEVNQSDPRCRWQLSWERPQKCPSPMVCPMSSRRPGQAQRHTSQKWQWGWGGSDPGHLQMLGFPPGGVHIHSSAFLTSWILEPQSNYPKKTTESCFSA